MAHGDVIVCVFYARGGVPDAFAAVIKQKSIVVAVAAHAFAGCKSAYRAARVKQPLLLRQTAVAHRAVGVVGRLVAVQAFLRRQKLPESAGHLCVTSLFSGPGGQPSVSMPRRCV